MPLLYLPENSVGGSHNVASNCQGIQSIVGVPKTNDGENSGGAYVLDSQSGKILHYLQQPCPERDDQFGSAVAMNCDGSRVLVSAKNKFGSEKLQGIMSPGLVYLFVIFDGSKARLLHTFHNPDPQDFDQFGSVVAMDQAGETIAIASPNHNHNEGVLYIFNKNRSLIRTLVPPIWQKTPRTTRELVTTSPRINSLVVQWPCQPTGVLS